MAKPEPLYMTEAEVAGRVGVTLAAWEDIAAVLEKLGLPPRDPLFKSKRYWPGIRAFLYRRNGVRDFESTSVVGAAAENWG